MDNEVKWEYQIFKMYDDADKRELAFNALGQMRWELVSIDKNLIAYFKRPIPLNNFELEASLLPIGYPIG